MPPSGVGVPGVPVTNGEFQFELQFAFQSKVQFEVHFEVQFEF